MIKSFRLQDTVLVANLQKHGTTLDLEERLIHPRSPLRSALLAGLFPITPQANTFIFHGNGEGQNLRGLSQARSRPGRPEQDVVFMAPALDGGEQAKYMWEDLLAHLCAQAGRKGYYRIYARLESDHLPALSIFKKVGFMPYAEESVYRLFPDGPLQYTHHPLRLRKQTAADSWSIQRIYAVTTPHAVQVAEGLAQGQWQVENYLFGDQGYRRGYVWESQGEISAVLNIHSGKAGYLFKILIYPDAITQISNLISAGLAQLKNANRLPIYCSFRTYQQELRSCLIDCGFTYSANQVVMVKHATVRAKDFLHRLVAAFETSPETQVATPSSALQSAQQNQNGDKPNNPEHAPV